jgi:hypothetical protein
MPPRLTPEIIIAAIDGFEAQKRRIDAQISELRAMQSGEFTENAALVAPTRRKRGRMSAAGRARIAEAQRKRWAELKGQSERETAVPAKRKRKLSAAGKAAIVAALKKRWDAKRAAATAKSAPTRKGSHKKAAAKKMAAAKRKTATAKKTAPPATQTVAPAST